MKRPNSKPTTTTGSVYTVDQSGRVEYTSHDTVVAISNGSSSSVLLKAAEKRILQKMFRTRFNRNRQYVYEVFSVLVYLGIAKVKPNSQVIIDKEYPGKEGLIKIHILEYDSSKQVLSAENINFGLVGKQSPAHHLAYATLKKRKQPSKIVTAADIMKIIFPSKKTGYSSISGTEGS